MRRYEIASEALDIRELLSRKPGGVMRIPDGAPATLAEAQLLAAIREYARAVQAEAVEALENASSEDPPPGTARKE